MSTIICAEFTLRSNRWFKNWVSIYGWLERESEIGRSKHCVTEESYDATTLIRCNFCHVLSVAWSHYYAKPVTHRRSVMSDLIAKNVKNCQHHHWFFLYIPKKSTYIVHTNLRYAFSSYHNVHKGSCELYFWAPDPLIHRFYYNLLTKGQMNLAKKYI